MNYIDFNHIQTLVNKGMVVFTREQADAAEAEMRQSKAFISSISSGPIDLGLTQNMDGEPMICSAYCRGFWLGILAARSSGDLVFNSTSVPFFLQIAFGTEFHDEAAAISAEYSKYWKSEDLPGHFSRTIHDFKAKLEAAGLINSSKKSFHLSPASLAEINAGVGQSQSGRLNAIITRYRAIMDNPDLAAHIAKMDALEKLS